MDGVIIYWDILPVIFNVKFWDCAGKIALVSYVDETIKYDVYNKWQR